MNPADALAPLALQVLGITVTLAIGLARAQRCIRRRQARRQWQGDPLLWTLASMQHRQADTPQQ